MSDLAKIWKTPTVQCPVGSIGHEYHPFDQAALYAFFRAARSREPVFYCPEIDYWVVSRYDDVLAILQDPQRFSAANANTPISPVPEDALNYLKAGGYALEGVQVNCDGPKHARIRASASQLLNPRQFATLEADIRRLVRESLEPLRGRGRVDLLADFAYELPARVIFLLLGISDEEAARVKQWAANRLLLSFTRPTYAQQMEAARNLLEYWHFTVGLVQQRLKEPKDDFPSRLLQLRGNDDAVLTLNEVNSVVFGLLFAGHETTTNQMANGLIGLLEDRRNWEAICEDPSLIPNAVEEALRFAGAVVNWRRRALCDVEIGGMKIPEGSNILMSFGSANHDESKFDDSGRFDVRRPNSRKHLTFGNGIHVCLGAGLARLEMKIMLEELTRNFPEMRIAADQSTTYAPAFAFRAPGAVWVDLK